MVHTSFELQRGVLRIADKPDHLITFGKLSVMPKDSIRIESTSAPCKLSFKSKYSISKSKSTDLRSYEHAVYEFVVSVDVARALRNNANIIEILVSPIDNTLSSRGKALSPEMIMMQSSNERHTAKKASNEIVGKTKIDVSSLINNEKTSIIAHDRDQTPLLIKKREIALKKASEFHSKGISVPIIGSTTIDSSMPIDIKRNLKQSAYACVLQGIDPAAVSKFKTNIGPNQAMSGFGNALADSLSRDPSDLLRERYFLFLPANIEKVTSSDGVDSDAEVPVVVMTKSSFAVATASIAMNAALLEDKMQVEFRLIDKRGIILETSSRILEHRVNIDIFHTPLIAPSIAVHRPVTGIGNTNIKLTQNDPRANSVILMKKIINRVTPQNSNYIVIGEFSLTTYDSELTVSTVIDSTNPIVYRAIASGKNDVIAANFNSAVLKPIGINDQAFMRRFRNATIITKIMNEGIAIEIRNVPCDTFSLYIERRDLTLKEKEFKLPDAERGIILVSAVSTQPLTLIDNNVKAGHIYEYRCMLNDAQGNVAPAARNAIIEYVPMTEGLVDTIITTQNLHDGGTNKINFTFSLETTVELSNTQKLKQMLEDQGLLDFFNDDLKSERALLKEMLAYRIMRINLTTGRREDFGVITSSDFSDLNMRKINAALPLRKGNSYRYEAYACLRTPESLLTEYKTKKSTNGISYNYKPSKFKHPLVFGKGTLSTPDTRFRNHAKDELTFGRVGEIASIEVTIPLTDIGVLDATAERIDTERVLITWRIASTFDRYDHFMIFKEIREQKMFVGSAHNITRSTKFNYLYELDNDDRGIIKFLIVPIFNDYSVGQEVEAKQVVVS